MARVKLQLPSTFHFSTEIQPRISDINYGGHLGHDAVLSLVHEARCRFLAEHGFSELNILNAAIIVSDVVIVYQSECFYGDRLKIDIAVGDFSRKGCDFMYRVTNLNTRKDVAAVKTGIVFFDYAQRKAVAVPQGFKGLFIDRNN